MARNTWANTTAPTPAAVGDLMYSTAASQLQVWNGTTWVPVGAVPNASEVGITTITGLTASNVQDALAEINTNLDTVISSGTGVTQINVGTGLSGGPTILSTGTIALAANPAGGQLNFAPINNPSFIGAVSIGGTAITDLFAPLNNPSGGQHNYLSSAGPTFTGTLAGPTLSLSANGTVGGNLAVTGTTALTGNATYSGTLTGPNARIDQTTLTGGYSGPVDYSRIVIRDPTTGYYLWSIGAPDLDPQLPTGMALGQRYFSIYRYSNTAANTVVDAPFLIHSSGRVFVNTQGMEVRGPLTSGDFSVFSGQFNVSDGGTF